MNTEKAMMIIDVEELRAMLVEAMEEAVEKAKKELPRFYTGKEVCEILHITEQTLWNMVKRGDIEKLGVGGRVLYDAQAIDEAIKKGAMRKYGRRN